MSSVWPVLHYDDTEAALRFLVDVVGFAESVVVRDDAGDVVHAELAWPGGGTVLFGGTKCTLPSSDKLKMMCLALAQALVVMHHLTPSFQGVQTCCQHNTPKPVP